MAASLPPGTTAPRRLPFPEQICWPLVASRDLFELRYGKALVEALRRPGSVPVYGTNGRCGNHDKALFRGPGVILGRKGQGPLGVEWCESDYWVIDTAYSLIPLRSDVDLKYAYFLIKHIGLNHLKDGTSNPTLSRDSFGAQALPLPPLNAQRAIAHILGTLDDKIELNRKMNETLEAMARALFKSWFVDFDPVRAKAAGRDTGLPKHLADLFPSSFENSALGKIPRGWKVDVLENALLTLEVGGRPKGGVSRYTDGVPSIGAESIVGLGIFDYSKTRYVPAKFFDEMTKGHVKSRDVLLYKDGGRPGEYEPHITMFGNGFPFANFAINEHVYRLRAKPEMGQNFLFFSLSSDFTIDEMRIKGTGVAIPGLNSTQVKSLTTLIPSRETIRAFDAIVEPWVARLLAGCNESRAIATLRDSLLPKLISGELRVKIIEPILGV